MTDGQDIVDWVHFERSRSELGPGFIRILSYFREDGTKSVAEIEQAMLAEPGVASVHDLHVWTISDGFVAMSGHVRSNGRSTEDVLHDLRAMLHERFGIDHMTLQVEAVDHADDGSCCILDPRCFVPSRVAAGAGLNEEDARG